MHTPHLLPLTLLPLLTAAHFSLLFPPPRGTDDENQATFPCGGYSQTQNRTSVSLTSIPISLDLGHTESLITVALALGNSVDSSFNTVILPTVQEYGPGEFCWASVSVPADLGIEEGMNATVQVITDSHGGGGLYNCADITFTSTTPSEPSACTNGTGISATPLAANEYFFANESANHGDGHSGYNESASGTGSGSASATGSGAAASASESGMASMRAVGWGVLGAGVLGAVALM